MNHLREEFDKTKCRCQQSEEFWKQNARGYAGSDCNIDTNDPLYIQYAKLVFLAWNAERDLKRFMQENKEKFRK